jgi:hypothetical protein
LRNRLNDALNIKEIRTFLWEKDAPGGKMLDEIMTKGIHGYNKILFIASENSIKSKACQFELSEGRKKQEQLWKTIFFPIHIDNYLFKIEKRDIRPTVMADEYWENIQELKRINSIDMSKFNCEQLDLEEFQMLVEKLIEDLRIED